MASPAPYSPFIMTFPNPTFPSLTGDAILAEDATHLMATARANSKQAANANPADAGVRDAKPDDNQRWDTVLARDSAHDGEFVFAVATTGVYCRPSCAARRPRRENVTFFSRPEQAEQAGFRACLRCRPRLLSGHPQSDAARAICRYIEQHLDESV